MVPAPMMDALARAAAAVQEFLALSLLPCSAVCCQDENAFGVMRKDELILAAMLAGEACENAHERLC